MSRGRDKRRRRKKKREKRRRLPPGPVVQSVCLATGQRFVTPLTGRYRNLSPAQLEQRVAELEQVWRDLGGQGIPGRDGYPPHLQAEYLEAIIDFELDPPCGCNDHALAAGGEA